MSDLTKLIEEGKRLRVVTADQEAWTQWRITYAADLLDAVETLQHRVVKLTASREFYSRRCEVLQATQSRMRDPERRAVCDVLANGSVGAETRAELATLKAQAERTRDRAVWICTQCHSPQDFSKDYACWACGGKIAEREA